MNKFKKWQENEISSGKQMIMLLIGALIFPTGIPAILVLLLPQVDKKMGIGSFYGGEDMSCHARNWHMGNGHGQFMVSCGCCFTFISAGIGWECYREHY